MAQLALLMTTLKQQLKGQKKTYADVAELLKLSESSVKRLFKNNALSISRLEKVCHMLGLEMTDLLNLMQENQNKISQLTKEQEKDIVSDTRLLLVAICVLNHWGLDDIMQHYTFSKAECIHKLTLLDALQIISLLPNNKIKLLVASNFSWLPNGPIQRFFQQHLQSDFFESTFTNPNELLLCLNGMLSQQCIQSLQSKIKQLGSYFSELSKQSAGKPIADLHGSALVIGLRPWSAKIFDQFKR